MSPLQGCVASTRACPAKGLKTKVGLTFRYAPAIMYMFDLIREGFIGDPYVFNGYEQNSQWLDPDNPMDKRIHKTKPVGEPEWGTDFSREGITVSSLEGYGAPTIDIGLECIGSDLEQVVGIMSIWCRFGVAPIWIRNASASILTTLICLWGSQEWCIVLAAIQLCDGWQLPRHRGPYIRIEGSHSSSVG